MPQTKFQRLIFALITVVITVNCFVFYCLSIEKGGFSGDVILTAYSTSFWVLPIPVVLMEFVIAMLAELFIGSPLSLILAFRVVNPRENKPFMVETAIICATVCIMCPLMSFIATILYQVIPYGFDTINFISKFLQTFIINFPFALLSQLFFIQPLVRFIFGKIYNNNQNQTEILIKN